MSVTHDYTARYWGHDYTITDVINDGQTLKLMGWGHAIAKNDFLILPNGSKTTRYQVKEISYYSDPSDMWRITATFAPRSSNVIVT